MNKNIEKLNHETTYFRARQVSIYLNIGLSTVWAMAKNQEITAIKISPRVTLFSKQEIDQLIQDRNN